MPHRVVTIMMQRLQLELQPGAQFSLNLTLINIIPGKFQHQYIL